MTGEEEILQIHPAVSMALILQIIILAGYTLALSLNSIPSTQPLMFIGFITLAAYFGVLTFVGIRMYGQYTAGDIRIRRLKLWAVVCIIHSLFPIITIYSALITFNDFNNLIYLLPAILLIISSVMVLVYSKDE